MYKATGGVYGRKSWNSIKNRLRLFIYFKGDEEEVKFNLNLIN